MDIKILKPREALNKAFLKAKPNRIDIDRFKIQLSQLLERANDTESEEFHKNLVSDFLKKTYYEPNHFINTKGRNDLVIHNGKNGNSTVGVILEAKKPTNKSEMLTTKNLNSKAFQELLLYYLRERITFKNLEIKHLIATNIYEWFIFDVSIFERLFAQNKTLVSQFDDFEEGRLADTKTSFFYQEIAEPLIAELQSEIEFTYFNLHDYKNILASTHKADDKQLIALFKLLSPEHLLKLPFANDSNTLDKRFYTELLHIIGLTEIKSGSKKLIERNKEGQRNSGSLLEDAIIQLDSLDKISRINKPHLYGNNAQQRLFNVALELCITWINRILFLKLLEAQLLGYHKGNKAYAFLSLEKLKNYNDLNSLFFQVLAKNYDDRNSDVKYFFEKVPYLNSSLFEPTELEQLTLFISNLQVGKTLPIFAQTVLKDSHGKKLSGQLNTFDYLLRFLDAYDFGSEGAEEIQEDNKPLINASVLGLIFEKINGYKDGSFFTPGFITMYMSRETLRKAVVQKFKEYCLQQNWQNVEINSIADIYELIPYKISKKQANEIVNSLKICDPAVGSGHFLVSVLNEIIAIKSELMILLDKNGKSLHRYKITAENDELVVAYEEEGFFRYYYPNNGENQRVQEGLFHEKQTLIENCLFGVDINPNSVKICRLRLWIELLKHAYYKNPIELETLPNIDINIKCGNSLISRFAIDADLGQALKKKKWTIESYRLAVDTYRNAENREQKREMERLITDIKSDFSTEISANDPKVKKLQNLKNELFQMANQIQLFEMSKKEKADWDKKIQQKTAEIEKLAAEIESIKTNQIFENAFEWRFEFPEVLNDNGDFVGFDVVIGNPPYGVSIKPQERKYLLDNISKVPDFEIYYWFIDRTRQILKENANLSYIIPNSLLFNVFAKDYRLNLFDHWLIDEILDCTEIKVFEDATVRNIIFQFTKKAMGGDTFSYRNTENILSFEDFLLRKIITLPKEIAVKNNQNWGLIFKLNKKILALIVKIKHEKIRLIDIFPETSQGLIPYDKYQGQSEDIIKNRAYHHFSNSENKFKKWLYGEDVTRYSLNWNGKEYIDYCEKIANPRAPKFFIGKRVLVREITNPSIYATLTNDEYYHDPAIIIIKDNHNCFSIECLLAILNSKLATFFHFNSAPKATKGAFPKILVEDVNNFPLPKAIDEKIKQTLHTIVNNILDTHEQNPNIDTSDFENQIDQLVYQLYDLTAEEIEIIENA